MIKSTFHICLKNGLEIKSLLILLFGSKNENATKDNIKKVSVYVW